MVLSLVMLAAWISNSSAQAEPTLTQVNFAALTTSEAPTPRISIASLVVLYQERPSASLKDTPVPCPSVSGDISLPELTGHASVTSCQTWQGQLEVLPRVYLTQATYGLTLQVHREAEAAPKVKVVPKLQVSFLVELSKPAQKETEESNSQGN